MFVGIPGNPGLATHGEARPLGTRRARLSWPFSHLARHGCAHHESIARSFDASTASGGSCRWPGHVLHRPWRAMAMYVHTCHVATPTASKEGPTCRRHPNAASRTVHAKISGQLRNRLERFVAAHERSRTRSAGPLMSPPWLTSCDKFNVLLYGPLHFRCLRRVRQRLVTAVQADVRTLASSS
jgi:hypothetical protein